MTPRRPTRRLIAGAHLAGGATLAVGTFLPWLYSGARGLDVYELSRVAHRLEIVESRWTIAPIALVPLLLALAALARWGGRRGLAHALSLVPALYTAAGAVVLGRTGIPTGWGIAVVLAGSGLITVSAAAELVWRPRPGEHPPAAAAPSRREASR